MAEYKTVDAFPAGLVVPPPSKSYSHRALLCAGLAAMNDAVAESVLENVGDSEDIAATMDCLRALGAQSVREGNRVMVRRGKSGGRVLHCRESGTTLRLLMPVAALDGEEWLCTAQGRLPDRPLGAYERVFRQSGVLFEKLPAGWRIRGPLRGGEYGLPGDISSQFISGLLFALPLAQEDSLLRLETPLESSAYVDMTLDCLGRFGIGIERPDARIFRIPGRQKYRAADMAVEPDFSQAAYFLGAAALGCPVGVRLPKKSLQGDAAILDILAAMGAKPRWEGDFIHMAAGPLHAISVDAREIPDLVPPIAALCCLAEGESRIHHAGRLRYKESDRLHALASELGKIGASIREEAKGLRIIGSSSLRGGDADAHNDHRIAMALALAAIRAEGPVRVRGSESVRKSYPGFWEDFEREARP